MEPAAVLAVLVKAQGVATTNAQLKTVQGQLVRTEAASAAMGATMQKTGASMMLAGKTLSKRVTLPLLAIGAAAVKMSADFGRSMTEVETQAGASHKEVKKLSKSILDLSSQGRFAQGPNELAEALYNIESVGFRGAKALDVLKTSSDFATIGNADLAATTSAVVGVLKTGIKGAKNLDQVMGTLNATIGAGKMHMEDLTGAIGTGFLGTAAALGLNLHSVGAALAELTSQGVPANSAATKLRMSMSLMANPTDKAREALEGIGIGGEELAHKLRTPDGILAALKDIEAHLQGMTEIEKNQLLSKAFGGARTGGTILQLLNKLGDLGQKQREIVKNAHDVNEALERTNEDPAVRLAKAWSAIRADLIKLGEVLLPIVVPAFLGIATAVGAVVNGFDHLSPATKQLIVYLGLAAAAAGPLLTFFGWMIAKSGVMIMWLERHNLVLGQNVIETQAAAVANAELAVSLQAATVAQRELLIANSSGAVTGAVPIIAGAGAGASTAARGAATGFARGLGAMLPAALAVVGIGNIITSAMEGDTKAAAYKSGGAIGGAVVGGIIGSFSGNTAMGAMIGGGLGSIIGGIVESAFDTGPHLGKLQHTIQNQAKNATQALKGQKDALQHLRKAEEHADETKGRQKHTTQAVTRAHKNLNATIRKFGPASHQAYVAEMRLAEAQHRDARTAHEAKEAHKLSGNALEQYRHKTVLVVGAEKARMPALNRVIATLSKKHEADKKNHDGETTHWRLLGRLVDKEEAASKIRKHIANLESQAQTVAGKKFAGSLRHMTAEQGAFGRKFKGIGTTASEVKTKIEDFSARGRSNLRTFAQKSTSNARIFGEAAESISEATGIATAKIETRLAAALNKMGVSSAKFNAAPITRTGEGGGGSHLPAHKQGGLAGVVSGTSPGDKHVLSINGEPVAKVESQEGIFVGNRSLMATMAAANASIPRRAGGGLVGERITGPPGAFRDLGQGAADHTLEAAKKYLKEHAPAEGTTSYMGVDMAKWVALALRYAAVHGSGNPQPTSGYRSHAQNVSEGRLYHSEHEETKYPGGAVDFGSPTTGLLPKLSVVAATKGYRYPLLAPIGFRDDGHASGTGHKYGGLIGYLQRLQKGGGIKDYWAGTSIDQTYAAMNPNNESGPTLPGYVIEALAEWAGLPGKTMYQITQGESSGHPGMDIPDSPGRGIGLWAVNTAWNSHSSAYLRNPILNALEAKKTAEENGLGHQTWHGDDHVTGWNLHYDGDPKAIAQHLGGVGADGGKPEVPMSDVFKHVPIGKNKRRHAKLKKHLKKIKGIGLSESMLGNLSGMTHEVERLNEYASNASSLSSTSEDSSVAGVFKGADEVAWVEKELSELLSLRNMLLQAEKQIEKKQKLVSTMTTKALKQVEKVESELKKNESSRTKLEFSLAKAKGKGDVKAAEHIAGEIWRLKMWYVDGKNRLGGSRSSLKALEAQSKGLITTRGDILGDGGDKFRGLKAIQGINGPMELMIAEPAIGTVGGDILAAQISLRELRAPKNNVNASVDNQVQNELLKEANQRLAVSEAQVPVLAGWDALRQGIMGTFAGAFAKGGSIASGMWGIAGEAGPELVHGPAQIFSSRDSTAMATGGSDITVNVNGDIVQAPGDTRPPIEVLDSQGKTIKTVLSAQGTGRRHPSRGGVIRRK